MGYTHKWYRPAELPKDRWKSFLEDWYKLYSDPRFDVVLYPPVGVQCSLVLPIMDDELVAFNGQPAYEDFFLARRAETISQVRPGLGFGFCKTAKLPYDLAVTSCLLIAKRHFGEAFEVDSDGEDPDWQGARTLSQGVLGYGDTFHIREHHQLIDCRL